MRAHSFPSKTSLVWEENVICILIKEAPELSEMAPPPSCWLEVRRLSVSLVDLQGLCASIGNPRHRPVLSFKRVPYSSSPIPIYHRPQRCDMTLNAFASLSKNAEPYTRGRRSTLYHLLLPLQHWLYHSRLSLSSHSSTAFFSQHHIHHQKNRASVAWG